MNLEEDIISIVKNHIFLQEHIDIEGDKARFDPDPAIAEAWERMLVGENIKDGDLLLIKHEQEEHRLMYEKGLSYREAHSEANNLYNWEATLDE